MTWLTFWLFSLTLYLTHLNCSMDYTSSFALLQTPTTTSTSKLFISAPYFHFLSHELSLRSVHLIQKYKVVITHQNLEEHCTCRSLPNYKVLVGICESREDRAHYSRTIRAIISYISVSMIFCSTDLHCNYMLCNTVIFHIVMTYNI